VAEHALDAAQQDISPNLRPALPEALKLLLAYSNHRAHPFQDFDQYESKTPPLLTGKAF